MRTFFSKEGLQCPFPISEASEVIFALMVSLMPISRDLGSTDRVLMSGSRAYLYHHMAGMQKNIYFWGLFFWLLHAIIVRGALAFLSLTLFCSLCFASSVFATMVASPVQFPL